jgi:hypothetical protein
MVSEMAIGGEVFGSCVREIFVSLEFKSAGILLCCEWNYLGFILAGKAAYDYRWRWAIVPGIGRRFRRFGLD